MCNRLASITRLFGIALVALAAGGCSLTMHLASLQTDTETTASVTRSPSPLDASLDEEDWRRAQAALSLAVDPQGSGQPVNWDNPTTKRKGTFVPAGNLVLIDNTVCRPFTATIQQAGQGAAREIRHAGQACRVGPGEWALRQAQPAPADITATIRPNGQGPIKLTEQPLPPPTTSILESNENAL